MSLNDAIANHYAQENLAATIRAHLVAGLDPANLTPADLAPVDEFHIGGRRATEAFAARFAPTAGARLLDVGCGIGGTSRFFATEYDCHVTGVDLTPEYTATATELAGWVGLENRVDYRQADATDLPFGDAVFDGAFMMHVGMNIPDKPAAYAELRRVVRASGGAVGIYDVLSGEGSPTYPVPWATVADMSFLASPADMRAMLTAAGFSIEGEENWSSFGIEFFGEMQRAAQGKPPALGIHLLMGSDASIKIANMVRSLEQGHIEPWVFLCR